MKHPSNFLVAVVALLTISLGLAVPQRAAATIVITSGSLEVAHGHASVSLAGEGFSLVGGSGTGVMPFGPFPPDSPLDLRVHADGSDLGGTFTLDGQSYRMGVAVPSPGFLGNGLVDFDAPLVMLPGLGEPTITLTEPFTFVGLVQTATSAVPPFTISEDRLTGSGIVTATLTALPLPVSGWEFQRASFDFQTPEPGTVMLFGVGLVGLGGMAWWRHHRG